MGGAGGPIPVIVLSGHAKHADANLPYSSWLNYCDAGYLVSAKSARNNLTGVLARLRQVGAEEAGRKHRMLREVSAAFTVVPRSSVQAPAAPEFVLQAACEQARASRNASSQAYSPRARGALPREARAPCLL